MLFVLEYGSTSLKENRGLFLDALLLRLFALLDYSPDFDLFIDLLSGVFGSEMLSFDSLIKFLSFRPLNSASTTPSRLSPLLII